jgi:hypothetical protein
LIGIASNHWIVGPLHRISNALLLELCRRKSSHPTIWDTINTTGGLDPETQTLRILPRYRHHANLTFLRPSIPAFEEGGGVRSFQPRQ